MRTSNATKLGIILSSLFLASITSSIFKLVSFEVIKENSNEYALCYLLTFVFFILVYFLVNRGKYILARTFNHLAYILWISPIPYLVFYLMVFSGATARRGFSTEELQTAIGSPMLSLIPLSIVFLVLGVISYIFGMLSQKYKKLESEKIILKSSTHNRNNLDKMIVCNGFVATIPRSQDNYVIRFKNESGKKIKAFKCSVNRTDDFGNVLSKFEISVDSTAKLEGQKKKENGFVFHPNDTINVIVSKESKTPTILDQKEFNRKEKEGVFISTRNKPLSGDIDYSVISFSDGEIRKA